MKRKRRHNPWRGRKWIDTRFARKYKIQKALGIAQAVMSLHVGHAQLNAQIACVPSVVKKLDIAAAVIQVTRSAGEIIKKTNDEADQRWRV